MQINELRKAVENARIALETAQAGTDTVVLKHALDAYQAAGLQLKAAEALNVKAAETVPAQARTAEKSNPVVDLAVSSLIAHHHKQPVATVIEKHFGTGDCGMVVKAASAIGESTVAGFAQELVSQRVMRGVVDLLHPQSFAAQMIASGMQVDLSGGSLVVPYRTITSKTNGTDFWRVEGAPIKTSAISLSKLTLAEHLNGSIIPVSNELITRADIASITAICQKALRDDFTDALDSVFLADADVTNAPKSLRVLAGAATKIGTTAPDIRTNLYKAIATRIDAGHQVSGLRIAMSAGTRATLAAMINSNGVAEFPGIMEGQGIGGVPIILAPALAADYILMVDVSEYAVGFVAPVIDVSTEASIALDPAKPAELTSLWQCNCTGLRLRARLGHGLMRSDAIHQYQMAATA